MERGSTGVRDHGDPGGAPERVDRSVEVELEAKERLLAASLGHVFFEHASEVLSRLLTVQPLTDAEPNDAAGFKVLVRTPIDFAIGTFPGRLSDARLAPFARDTTVSMHRRRVPRASPMVRP